MKSYNKRYNYKKWHDKRCQKLEKNKRKNKKYDPYKTPIYLRNSDEYIEAEPISAPKSLCLLENTEECLYFFKNMRKDKNISKFKRVCFIQIDLTDLTTFDYSSICILISIIRDLETKNILIRGNFPKDDTCKNKIKESGLLNFMRDNQGNPFKKSSKSDLLFLEKGSKSLSKKDNIRISENIRNAVEHLTGEKRHLQRLRKIILEICGNSIEWSGTKKRQWLLGVMYDEKKVIFTITDVGKGILKTLNLKLKYKLNNLPDYSNEEILKNAFEKKYESSSREINRNKGLPSVKKAYDDNLIENLKVVTNDVMLDYGNLMKSYNFKSYKFDGTFYRWTITRDTVHKNL